ncbi:MAG: glycosyltransferase [Actinomycetota bacterium]
MNAARGSRGEGAHRVSVLSLHTSPLAQPGKGDAGGMNVYVRELAAALAHRGADCTVYVRRWHDDLPGEVRVEPGVRVAHVDAGAHDLPKEELPGVVDAFRDGVLADIEARGGTDIVHANYWLSGVAGHAVKHELDLPLVTTFHTLARVKAETGDDEPQRRIDAEAEVISCSDVITANSVAESQQLVRLYDADPLRIEEVAPGVEHALFSPGDQAGARRAIGLGAGPVLMFVGRIQPLKGVDVAVRAFAALGRPDATLLIVGGASGTSGDTEVDRIDRLVDDLGVRSQVRFVEPQPHHMLSTYYRAADLVLAPSRSESFGLVALEAAACGTPVVAAAVGGLRTLVEHGRTGFLVEGRDPAVYAAFANEILDSRLLAAEIAMNAAERARAYTWTAMADRLMGIYAGLRERQLVSCS